MEKIEYISIKDIKPYPNNPRNNINAIEAVANSIKEFGFKSPIILDKDNIIVCGHTRYEASKRLRLKEVPVIYADDLTDEQVKAFRLADNKTAELSDWDFDILDAEIDAINDINMADFGFEFKLDIPSDIDDEPEEDEFDDVEKMEKHYGVPYQGNKSRIADIIVKILPEGARLVDLFGGGWSNNPLCDAER